MRVGGFRGRRQARRGTSRGQETTTAPPSGGRRVDPFDHRQARRGRGRARACFPPPYRPWMVTGFVAFRDRCASRSGRPSILKCVEKMLRAGLRSLGGFTFGPPPSIRAGSNRRAHQRRFAGAQAAGPGHRPGWRPTVSSSSTGAGHGTRASRKRSRPSSSTAAPASPGRRWPTS